MHGCVVFIYVSDMDYHIKIIPIHDIKILIMTLLVKTQITPVIKRSGWLTLFPKNLLLYYKAQKPKQFDPTFSKASIQELGISTIRY